MNENLRKLSLDIEGQMVEATVAYSRGTLWVHMNGETFTYEVPKRQSRRGGRGGAAGGAHPGEIVAPMPGKIIKLLVEPGAKVTANQVLLVMEAMKMEYTLKAQADGTVAQINCEPGQQVSLGQSLVKLEV